MDCCDRVRSEPVARWWLRAAAVPHLVSVTPVVANFTGTAAAIAMTGVALAAPVLPMSMTLFSERFMLVPRGSYGTRST